MMKLTKMFLYLQDGKPDRALASQALGSNAPRLPQLDYGGAVQGVQDHAGAGESSLAS